MSSSPVTNNPEGQSVENDVFYFGGPLFGINNPTLPCNSEVLTNSDGTRVAFCVDPRPPATRAPVGLVERGPVGRESEDLFATPDLEDDFGDAERMFENAQTVFQYAENGLNEDLELSSSTSTEDIDMANMEENRNLLLLADAALGTYSQEGQEPAHATTPGDLPRDEEQPAHTTPVDSSPHDDEQPAQVPAGFNAINSGATTGQLTQVPAIRGSTAINSSATAGGFLPAGFTATNSAATSGEFTPTIPRPLSYGLPASTRPPQPATNQSRKREPRTTGFNPTTGEGMLTHVCRITTPFKGTPVASKSKLKGKFRCPRCNGRYTRPRSVKDHFIKCVGKYGNPGGLSWWDHGTLADTKAWHLDHLPQAEEEEEDDDDDEMPDEGDDEREVGEGDDGSMVL